MLNSQLNNIKLYATVLAAGYSVLQEGSLAYK